MNNRRHASTRNIVIRPASDSDTRPLLRLAALDDRRAIGGPAMVAEVNGELRAAVSLRDGRAIADPFHRTASLVGLLSTAAVR